MLGPTRPDRLTIWPVETGEFGIDVRWGGGEGNTRATVVRRLLTEAGVKAKPPTRWTVKPGSCESDRCRAPEVAKLIDSFIW